MPASGPGGSTAPPSPATSAPAEILLERAQAEAFTVVDPYPRGRDRGRRRRDRAALAARKDPRLGPHLRRHRRRCGALCLTPISTATTTTTARWSPSGSSSSATRCAAASPGELTEEQFKPLRLTNGLYLQLHAYMLRIAIPYGTLSSRQLRKLADIARKYDRGYGHFTTRQNLQLNWIKLEDAPDALAALAEVDMHAMQTSRQCHPQRHRRSFRRRRDRRDRGPAHLVRDRAPVVDAASRVQLPAAQVQDRRHRLAQRPRRRARARHRPAPVAQRGRARSASR